MQPSWLSPIKKPYGKRDEKRAVPFTAKYSTRGCFFQPSFVFFGWFDINIYVLYTNAWRRAALRQLKIENGKLKIWDGERDAMRQCKMQNAKCKMQNQGRRTDRRGRRLDVPHVQNKGDRRAGGLLPPDNAELVRVSS